MRCFVHPLAGVEGAAVVRRSFFFFRQGVMVLDQSVTSDADNRATGIAVVTWTGVGLIASVLFCSGCWTTNAGRIERVLAADRKASQGASSVRDIVQRMQAIDTSGCPADFRTAYLAHVHAWEEAAIV